MPPKLKIAQVVSTYPPYRGGMGKVAQEYTERLRVRGYNVHVFTPSYRSGKDEIPYVHRVPSLLHLGNASVSPSLFARIRGFDMVHLHYPFFGGAEPVMIRKALRHEQKLVISYHMDPAADGAKGLAFAAHQKLVMPWIMEVADRILVSSRDYAAASALAKLPKIHDKIEIHPFGVDLARFHPGDAPEVRERLQIRPDLPLLLFVGGLDRAHAFKGLPVLLEALKQMTRYAWHAAIIGEGDLRASYQATADASGLAGRVTFLGPLEDESLTAFYRASDVHCFPSTAKAEAFGLVALEAAASGVPTVASHLPGVRSVVLDGETGLLVPPAHADELRRALVLLLEQVELRKRLGRSARAHAELVFAWDPLLDKLEKTYQDVCSLAENIEARN